MSIFNNSTELDSILENLDRAMLDNDYWDASAYASQALEYIKNNGMNPDIDNDFKEGLINLLTEVVKAADDMTSDKSSLKKINEKVDPIFTEDEKEILIDEILNTKGPRIKLR